jgi:hypothetical protein
MCYICWTAIIYLEKSNFFGKNISVNRMKFNKNVRKWEDFYNPYIRTVRATYCKSLEGCAVPPANGGCSSAQLRASGNSNCCWYIGTVFNWMSLINKKITHELKRALTSSVAD